MLDLLASIVSFLWEKDIVGYAAYGALVLLFVAAVYVIWKEMSGAGR